jgi:hypothetical protein
MVDFDSLVARHGEYAVQALLERIERDDGIPARSSVPLEERWKAAMSGEPAAHARLVA